MKQEIFFVQDTDHVNVEAINQLRMQEYSKAQGFAVQVSTLNWKQSDSESFVMAARTEDKITSTMRGEFIDDQSLLEKKLEYNWDFPMELNYPVLLLSRAATVSAARTLGLNLLLRNHFLKLALQFQVQHVVGTFVAGSSRERTLREMGYQFFENPKGWQKSTYRSLRPVQVVVLDLKIHGQQALEYCQTQLGPNLKAYSFIESIPKLKIVRCL